MTHDSHPLNEDKTMEGSNDTSVEENNMLEDVINEVIDNGWDDGEFEEEVCLFFRIVHIIVLFDVCRMKE